ncbi:ABC-type oligopeptide transport system, periplasmic component [Luminiphilus syltensis NOR5-1B]|uniref:ABC-type oligopeptide transport system, periplasmic component n=1 Tax=Luminiphilus syltensis NOR5-1B TaxID=565045 RepID=B8KX64_9GAMM|nr:extracellular solute-binding protein [Luminiphilus syltensis]EED35862.1 ABC-type oligopeptide transport system, periplasmic component [Luminiphilus syltensis NOR5-1B]
MGHSFRQPGTFIRLLLVGLVSVMFGCGGGDSESESVSEESGPTLAERLDADYGENPEFYTFKTPADLRTDLVWENGADEPEVGSPLAKKGGTNYIHITDFPRTLRTVGPDSNGSFRNYILDDVIVTLALQHPDTLNFIPGLAKEWALDEETGTVYVRLDPDARWSDGVPITSDDFLFMFWFYTSEEIRAPWYNNWFGSRYTNITRFDEHTFSVTFATKKPDFAFRVLGLHPIPQHFYDEFGSDFVERYQWRFSPTTGPYVLEEGDLRKGRAITLTRNKDWWARDKKHYRYRYNPDRLQFSVIRDTAKRFEAFKRGDLDQFLARTAAYWYEKLPDSDPDVQAGYIAKSTFYNQFTRPPYGLWINTSKPLLDDRNIRLGIQHASNWQLVIDQYFRGDANRINTPAMGYGAYSHPTLKARVFDVQKAQEYFAQAGFRERGPDGILVNADGKKLAFTLSTGYERFADILTILKQEAAKAGLEFRVEMMDATAAWKKVQEKKHEIHFVAFALSGEEYPRFWDFYHSDNAYDDAFLEDGSINPERMIKPQTNNLEVFADPEMDSMIDAYRASSDREEMVELSHRMLERHYDYGSFVPGFYKPAARLATWRWVRFPDYFNHRRVQMNPAVGEWWLHWIDGDLKEEVLSARESDRTFPPEINVYDQWKE